MTKMVISGYISIDASKTKPGLYLRITVVVNYVTLQNPDREPIFELLKSTRPTDNSLQFFQSLDPARTKLLPPLVPKPLEVAILLLL